MLRSVTLNATIHDSAVFRAQELSTSEITDAIRATIGSRRHNAFVTPLETLTDILVHSQDIAIPLGLDLDDAPGAGALAATRRWDTRGTWLATVNRRLPLDDHRFRATDINWTRGRGPRGRRPHRGDPAPAHRPHRRPGTAHRRRRRRPARRPATEG